MDDSRLDALAYPVVNRIAPIVGGNQLGSNEACRRRPDFPR